MSDADNVRVAVRVRPLSNSERDRGCLEQVKRVAGEPQVAVANTDAFTFNYVFDTKDSQEKLYNDCVLEMLDGLFKGFNATILAYGQTGSGKTYTMGTAYDGDLCDDTGVIPRAMVDLFNRMENLSKETEFTVTCSFMELYQEQLYDLLSSQPREQNVVELREDRNGFVIPTCLTEELVRSARDTTDCLMRGSKGRAVGCTAMNQHSSRSHAIFTVTIKSSPKNETGIATTSKFRLVDLAGSERSKKTQTTGDRFKEGVKINQGLLALGNVISALGSNQGSGFVRYRDSKLTRLLQDSLGGNSITLMIACISPADYNIQETLSTLRYADRARRIKNKPIINKEPTANEIKHLNRVIRELYTRLIEAGGCIPAELTATIKNIISDITPTSSVTSLVDGNNCDQAYQVLMDKYAELQKQMRKTMQDLIDTDVRAHTVEAACEKTKSKTHDIMVILNSLRSDLTTESSANELDDQNKRIQNIKDVMIQLNNDLEEMQQEIDTSAKVSNGGSAGDTDEVCTLMEEEEDDYVKKQSKYKQELAMIKAELDLKNELRERVEGNLNKMTPIDESILEKYRESEHKIRTLEAEKAELEEKLNQKFKDSASAKLAESRRQRLQVLEQELSKIRMQRAQQEKTLKQYQVQVDRVKDLNTQIQKMKESKVKLIRTMRQESEIFRQWKFAREKELAQLRNKDRKLMNEMERQKAAHTRIYNNLQRRLEEANAAKKRYIERDMAAQKIRMALHNTKGAPQLDRLINLIERDIEVVMSLIEAENSLKHLKDDRIALSTRIDELEKTKSASVENSPEAEELANLKNELELRKTQISEIEQKVLTADKTKRMNTICDNIVSVGDTRNLLRRLLNSMLTSHSETVHKLSEQLAQSEELRNKMKISEERGNELSEQLRNIELEHERRLLEQENAYEEKVTVLLRELQNKIPSICSEKDMTPEQQKCMKIREEQLNKFDALREELDYYKELVTNMKNACMTQKRRKVEPPPPVDFMKDDELNEIITDDDDFEDNDLDDPDWRKTPKYRKRSKQTSNRNNSIESVIMEENSEPVMNGADATYPVTAISALVGKDTALKRKGGKCYCRGKCSNNRCGCHANGENCKRACRCGDTCVNGKTSNNPSDDNDSSEISITDSNGKSKTITEMDENTFKSPLKPKEISNSATFALENNTFITPKIARMSTISFESASARKKFFE